MTVLQGSCEAVTEASTEQSSATSAIQVTAACKNGGLCTSEHCVRIDIKAQGVSLLAAMFKVASTLLFDTTGAFSAVVPLFSMISREEMPEALPSVELPPSFTPVALRVARFLQDDEEGKFLIEIPLADRSVPVVVDSVAEENTGRVLGLSRVAGAGIATVLGMLF